MLGGVAAHLALYSISSLRSTNIIDTSVQTDLKKVVDTGVQIDPEILSAVSDTTITPKTFNFTQEQLTKNISNKGVQTFPETEIMVSDHGVQTHPPLVDVGIQHVEKLRINTLDLNPPILRSIDVRDINWSLSSTSEKSVQNLFHNLERSIQTMDDPNLIVSVNEIDLIDLGSSPLRNSLPISVFDVSEDNPLWSPDTLAKLMEYYN